VDQGWCILRSRGRFTLRLEESLNEDGFEAWTPKEVRKIRIPRTNVRRTVVLPLMPSYVFARANHLVDLLLMAEMSVKPRRARGQPAHVDFSVMHFHDSIPLIGDRQLQALRHLEAKRTPRAKAQRTFADGVEVVVKIEGGSFAGMKGVVRKSDTSTSLVCFSERMSVKIPTYLLSEIDIGSQSVLDRAAAREAA
jgi:transcription antitermination factor NusG